MFEKFRTRSTELERLDNRRLHFDEYKRGTMRFALHSPHLWRIQIYRKTLVPEIAGREKVSVLDVGAGQANCLKGFARCYLARAFCCGSRTRVRVCKVDQTLGQKAVLCNALKLPFETTVRPFHSSLFLHHLDDDEGAVVLSEMARVATGRIFAITSTVTRWRITPTSSSVVFSSNIHRRGRGFVDTTKPHPRRTASSGSKGGP